LRGEVRGSVPGDQFARTLFEVWFGPTPGDERLKRGMLGK
jgi:chalcone isomerase-like protein